MSIFFQILSIIEYLFLFIVGIQVLYFLVFSIASIFPYKVALQKEHTSFNKIAVIIPGYNEDRIIIETAESALLQSYPKEYYRIIICADHFGQHTIDKLEVMDLTVLEVKFENSTKAKSVNKALALLNPYEPDIAVILDADNHMATDFLDRINHAYNSGYKIIQGHRTAKNDDSNFALLDAINEEIGNSIFRKGHRVLGYSSALIGSAMAFEYEYLRTTMEDIEDVAGEDKLLELLILEQGLTIEYLDDALVYDEKVANASSFSKQRTRWVGVQIYFLKNYFFDGVKKLILKGNFDYFDKTFQMFLIPKVLLIGGLCIMGILALLNWVSFIWLFLMIGFYLALALAIPRRFYNLRLLKALFNVPKAILFMILAILRIKKSTATKFERTEKGVTLKK